MKDYYNRVLLLHRVDNICQLILSLYIWTYIGIYINTLVIRIISTSKFCNSKSNPPTSQSSKILKLLRVCTQWVSQSTSCSIADYWSRHLADSWCTVDVIYRLPFVQHQCFCDLTHDLRRAFTCIIEFYHLV